MLEGIKILADRIVDLPELYDTQPRVTEVKTTDPEIPVEQQIAQLIKIVYDNEYGVFTEEEINHIKEAERECRRKVFNAWLLGIVADQYVYLPETREQKKERLQIEQEEQKWRMEREKEKRQMERERQLAMEQMQQRARHDEMLRGGGRGIANNLTGGLF
jgi:hypothetical protein